MGAATPPRLDTRNADFYLEMPEDYVWPMVSAWDNINDVIFMQDGAPPHFANVVRAGLDEKFPGRWLGRREKSKPDTMRLLFMGLGKR